MLKKLYFKKHTRKYIFREMRVFDIIPILTFLFLPSKIGGICVCVYLYKFIIYYI